MNLHYLYLPSQDGHLVKSTRLICNDAPSFNERVTDVELKFLLSPLDCGYSNRGPEEIFSAFPQHLRPGMLSALVQESLIESVKLSDNATGVASQLNKRIKSEEFLHAIARLIYNDTLKSNHSVNQQKMYSVLERLSLITVHEVDKVCTHLIYKDKHIHGSEVEKTCFVQKVTGARADIVSWNVYIRNESRLGQDLLIPLAEVINTILSGWLHDSVLYLLPILACEESQIQKKLDSFNVRLDHRTANREAGQGDTASLISLLGEVVKEQHREMLKPGETEFEPEEYVGYQTDAESPVIYGRIREEIQATAGAHRYLVDISADHDSMIVQASQLLKYV